MSYYFVESFLNRCDPMKPKAKPKSTKQSKAPASPKSTEPVIDLCGKCGQLHARCKAHKKRKSKDDPYEPCNRYPNKGSVNGVCRNHGGESLHGIAHPNFKDGHQSKYMYLPTAELQERARRLASDTINNLTESVSITAMFESRFLERVGTTESTEAWKMLAKAVQEYRLASDEAEAALAFGMIASIVEQGVGESRLINDIYRSQEHQRKLSETISKIKLQTSQALSLENWEWFLSIVLRIIRQNVEDRATLTNIQRDFQLEFRSRSEQP